MTIADVWICYEGHFNNQKERWEQMRILAFNVARFGNSDPKKFPNTPQKFWKLPWDKKGSGKHKLSARELIDQYNKQNING